MIVKYLNYLYYIIFVIAFSYVTYNIINLESEQKVIKEEVASQRNAANGIFNPNIWKQKVLEIVKTRIDSTDLNLYSEQVGIWTLKIYNSAVSSTRKKGLFPDYKGDISLNNTFAWFEELINRGKDKTGIWVGDQLVPKIIAEAKKEVRENEQSLKDSLYTYIFNESNPDSSFEIETFMRSEIVSKAKSVPMRQKRIDNYVTIFLIISLLFLIIGYFLKKNSGEQLKHLLLINIQIIAIACLIIGITTSMLEIIAELKNVKFSILGSQIHFFNQVIYYQRKSIIDVATVIYNTAPFVSIFVILFSIVFPTTKTILLSLSIFNKKIMKNKVIYFIITNIGKWSMADVFIVALFLAYFGFNAIIENQMNRITDLEDIKILVNTSKTSLQIGFYFFLSYVIISLVGGTYYKYWAKKALVND